MRAPAAVISPAVLEHSTPVATEEGWRHALVPALRATVVTLLLTGLAYPLFVTGLAQVLFPSAANGSLVKDGAGRVVGSELIAQGFAAPAYFQPRPSAAGAKGYDATASSGSNLGPTSKKLQDGATAALAALVKDNPGAVGLPQNYDHNKK
jgi:K+-transporting ATPase ATPase C chain